jgi:23S rRNA pseudouridine1911/1915/1917 synthase
VLSLLEVRLETGRTHQIRVHLASIGHPVVSDRTYGRRDHIALRQFLHAARLGFRHPITGSRVEAESPLPADLRSVLDALGDPDSGSVGGL